MNQYSVNSYEDAVEAFKHRRPAWTKKKLDNNTYLHENGEDCFAIVLHDTAIVTFTKCGRVILHSGGWRTKLTKERMNRYLPPGYMVYSKRGVWYLGAGACGKDSEWVFKDGITIILGKKGKHDKVVMAGDEDTIKRTNKLKRKIDEHAKGYVEALTSFNMPSPGGDPWIPLQDNAGRPMKVEKTILFDYTTEHYYPSNVLKAALEYGHYNSLIVMDAVARMVIFSQEGHEEERKEFEESNHFRLAKRIVERDVRRAVRRYFQWQFGIGA